MLDNDKLWVIWVVGIICLAAMWKLAEPASLIDNAITGLFGVATGYAIGKGAQ